MDITTFDGFLTSVIIGPDLIQASEWIPTVFGSEEDIDFNWKSDDEAKRTIDLLIKFNNSLAATFESNTEDFGPYLIEDEKNNLNLDKWCSGFLTGVGLNENSWEILAQSADGDELLYPIFLFGLESGKDVWDSEEFKQISIDSWIDAVIDAVLEIQKFWKTLQDNSIGQPALMSEPKIGRNALCPCGSGKKYKYCCMN